MPDLTLSDGAPRESGPSPPDGLPHEQLRRLLEAASVAVFSLDARGRVTYLNPEAERVLQRPRRELLGRPLWNGAPDAEPPLLLARIRRALERGEHAAFECDHPPLAAWLDVHASPLDGGLAVFATDVTERVRAEQARREREHRFRQILDSLQDMVFCKSRGLAVTYANRATCRYYGMSEEELRGITDVPFNEIDFTQQYLRDDLHVLRTGETLEREEPNRAPDGGIRVFHTIKTPILDTRGQVAEIVGVSRDVTERSRAAEALRQSEERFRTVAHATADVVWVSDAAGAFVTEQADWEEFTGQPFAEHGGWGWLECAHPDDRERIARGRTPSAAGEARDLEYRLRRADGEYRWMRVRAVPLRDAEGAVREWVGVETDVTAQRRAASAQRFLAEASAILGSSLDYEETLLRVARVAVPAVADWCIVYLLGAEGTVARRIIAAAEPEKERILRELDARFPTDFIGGDHPVGRVIRTGEPLLVPVVPAETLEGLSRDAEHRDRMRALNLRSFVLVPLSVRGARIGAIALASGSDERRFDSADRSVAEDLAHRAEMAIENATLFREVCEAREALESQAAELEIQSEELQAQAAELEEARAELEALNAELCEQIEAAESSREEADRANQAKSDFLASMSHELRTPLNAIGGYVDLLQLGIRGPLSEQQLEDLRKIKRNQRHLLGLISDILNFAKLEVGRVRFDIAEVPVDATLAAMEPLIAPQLAAKELRYRFRGGDGGVAVRADPERLEQIVLNLLTNAVKYTGPGGRVELSWRADADRVVIEVADSGSGIPAEKLEVIFEPFVQLTAQPSRTDGGVGLGLAISRDLARAMGGELSVRSTPGRGSTFALSLPRAPG